MPYLRTVRRCGITLPCSWQRFMKSLRVSAHRSHSSVTPRELRISTRLAAYQLTPDQGVFVFASSGMVDIPSPIGGFKPRFSLGHGHAAHRRLAGFPILQGNVGQGFNGDAFFVPLGDEVPLDVFQAAFVVGEAEPLKQISAYRHK